MITIDGLAFVQVFLAALAGTILVVGFYALAIRLLVRAGRIPLAPPAEFTDAITVMTPKEQRRAAKAAAKAARRNPLTPVQRRIALVGAYCCFGLCAIAVLGGILLIVRG
ncbi:peptidase [Microbacterium sp.]|uniref:peptidase n=1 Tax=Microbacterium sp. TaxID=51671 RepID=UPI003A8609BD